MPVEKDGGLAGSLQGFRVDEGMEICWDDLDVFETSGAEMVGDPARAALDIGFVLALGADTGNAQKFGQFSEMLVTGSVNKVSKIHERSSGA